MRDIKPNGSKSTERPPGQRAGTPQGTKKTDADGDRLHRSSHQGWSLGRACGATALPPAFGGATGGGIECLWRERRDGRMRLQWSEPYRLNAPKMQPRDAAPPRSCVPVRHDGLASQRFPPPASPPQQPLQPASRPSCLELRRPADGTLSDQGFFKVAVAPPWRRR